MNTNLNIKEVIFWGATGQARVLYEYLSYTQQKLVALFDNNTDIKSPFTDVPLYHGEKSCKAWIKKRTLDTPCGFYVAIGGEKGRDRLEIYNHLVALGLTPMQACHPSAFIAENVRIGSGSQILAKSAVCTDVQTGRCCIINTSASIDHECQLGDGVHICPGVTMAGCVNVGSFVTIGTGATVLPNISIGEGAIIGAGSVVTENVPANTVIVGNPARVVKEK